MANTSNEPRFMYPNSSGQRPMMAVPEGPFRSNYTEAFAAMFSNNHQQWGIQNPCGDFQMNSIECLEAYGSVRGRRLCMNYIEDLGECLFNLKQAQRQTEMKKERLRQVMRGQRKMADLDAKVKPPPDSFQEGPFTPA